MTAKPTSIRVRMYNVGFGDCFLLTFRYPGGPERHMLIDYGTNARGEKGINLAKLGDRIAADSGGKLAAIALSHRHRDHIKGFDPDVGGQKIKALAPDVVLRPWTEEPGVEDPVEGDDHAFTLRRDFARSLSIGEDLALGLSKAVEGADGRSLRGQIGMFAAEELKNREAVELLHELSEGERGRYLSAGMNPNTDEALPGVKISVLGPPLPEAWPAVRRQRSDDPEFWLELQGSLPAALTLQREAPETQALLGPEAWLVEQLRSEGLHSALRVVMALDEALNNTSLVLLIEAAGRRLLFPGDAQIENWSYSLTGPGSSDELRSRLADLDFYKVGHHGSRNATPKLSLMPLWQVPGAPKVPVAFMSTLPGQYDEDYPVPADGLVTAFTTPPFQLVRTDDLPAGKDFADLEL